MVVAGIAVDDIQILYLLEMMLGSVGRIDARHTWVEAAAEDSCQTGLLETLTIGPLPRVLEVSLVFGLVVGCVEIGAATGQTGVHDGQVLIGQGEVDDQLRLVAVEQCLQLFHIVSIHLCSLDVQLIASLVDVFYYLVAFRLSATCNHKLCEHVSVLSDLERCYCCDAPGANH